jgi:hypothetical protein
MDELAVSGLTDIERTGGTAKSAATADIKWSFRTGLKLVAV